MVMCSLAQFYIVSNAFCLGWRFPVSTIRIATRVVLDSSSSSSLPFYPIKNAISSSVPPLGSRIMLSSQKGGGRVAASATSPAVGGTGLERREEYPVGNQKETYQACPKCHGQGKILKPPSRKARLRYNKKPRWDQSDQVVATADAVANEILAITPDRDSSPSRKSSPPPPPRLEPCPVCQSTGLLRQVDDPCHQDDGALKNSKRNNDDLPRVVIVGGGIGGLALAVACRHRGIPHVVLERDAHFSQRRQGYGLTLQQASKALKHFGYTAAEDILQEGITSTKHVVHTADGKVVGEWGLRKWGRPCDQQNKNQQTTKEPKRQNIHIARQALRYHLWRAADESKIMWNSRLVRYQETDDGIELSIQRGGDDGNVVTQTVDLLVGADGIRSQVRKQLIGEEATPLRYLGCLVVLGICPVRSLDEASQSNELLDGATVFQSADGHTRMYMMPFSTTEYMWQLSFPLSENESTLISARGPMALKEEALRRCGTWHCPIPEILRETPLALVSGYPVYDRALLPAEQLWQSSHRVTLIGDACHPMSPFKGQGANQAMLDALSLANAIYRSCGVEQNQKEKGLEEALKVFAQEMFTRSSVKVQASADAVQFLHSDVVLQVGNITRGAAHRAAVGAASGSSSSGNHEAKPL